MHPHLSVCMMVKDEEFGILISLNSVKTIVNSIVVLDTGSVDNTIGIVREWCIKNRKPFYLKTSPFLDFSTSRNILLDFADTAVPDCDYQLLLDAQDVLCGIDAFSNLLHTFRYKQDINAFMIRQCWISTNGRNEYYNVRLIRPRCGWRYKYPVHELIENTNGKRSIINIYNPNIIIQQDRTRSGATSEKRYIRDKTLLLQAYQNNPKDGRTVFYLAQTFLCLQDIQHAYIYFMLRPSLGGFYEEIFHAYLRAGECAERLNKSCIYLYMKAFCCFNMNRAEPLVNIATYYQKRKHWKLAYTFAKFACTLEYPETHLLFVNTKIYSYTRWHIMGVVSYYCGTEDSYSKDGLVGAQKALQAGYNKEIDAKNITFYRNRLSI